jgi:hypothetical protein
MSEVLLQVIAGLTTIMVELIRLLIFFLCFVSQVTTPPVQV